MSLASALHAVPKPVLFGLYGALGGLVGALFLGEPAWALLKPPPPVPPKPTLAVSVSPSVQVYAGQSNTFTVQAAAGGPASGANPAVVVHFDGGPPGVKVPNLRLTNW